MKIVNQMHIRRREV